MWKKNKFIIFIKKNKKDVLQMNKNDSSHKKIGIKNTFKLVFVWVGGCVCVLYVCVINWIGREGGGGCLREFSR